MDPVTTSTFISQSILNIRNDLLSNITDPIQSTRPSGQKFVMTSYPMRAAVYPIITIKKTGVSLPRRLGMQSVMHEARLPIEVRVWARNVKEKDNLTQLVINRLRSIALDPTTGSIACNMLDFQVPSVVDVDEEGAAGIKSSIITTQYKFIVGS